MPCIVLVTSALLISNLRLLPSCTEDPCDEGTLVVCNVHTTNLACLDILVLHIVFVMLELNDDNDMMI